MLLLAAAFVISLQTAPPRAGFVDQDYKRRQDSLLDLEKLLRERGVLPTPHGELTDLKLVVESSQKETLDASRTVTSNRPQIFGGGQRSETVPIVANVVRLKLQFGDYVSEVIGVSADDPPTWTGAARDATKQIMTWLQDNQARICAESPRSCF